MQSSDEHFREDDLQPRRAGSVVAQLHQAEVRQTFLDFHQREYVPVVAFLRQAGATLENAEDAAQEAFLTAWRQVNRPGIWQNIEQPRAWIRKVAIHEYFQIVKQALTRTPTVTDITDIIPPDQSPDHGELTVECEFVRAILHKLDPETRIVMAFHIDGFRSIDIARQLNMTDQKVRDLTKKGRKLLKAGLAPLREHHGRQVL